ncbi:hypothetical protein FVA74_08420 [Salinibacterium sp. dk2585]|uniref:hypothetical protein n=1 Tax=unclassified Salinibacterium TaxID=2632331 RepID=UPI0011C25326|nr:MULTISPECIES: hypothetical protein [unclassified Salinibacterium]QEE61598.1 hypothetical protein FVA74_08420 [Salinibacterium sp. dk2585]TXK52317.1 hypothetical protein FVP63_13335 [Salinibacterium sp. dk5596]
MSLDMYWKRYDQTLALIRAEKPTTFAGVKLILDRFEPPSSGDAFFPGGADDTLADAMNDAGWSVKLEEGDYLWTAVHPYSGAVVQHVEGDVYCLLEGQISPRGATIATTDGVVIAEQRHIDLASGDESSTSSATCVSPPQIRNMASMPRERRSPSKRLGEGGT